MSKRALTIDTAAVFAPLLKPARYKGAYGGRGSGKSEFFASLAIEEALAAPGEMGEGLRIVCIREVQKDLKHSAKSLIERQMHRYGIGEAEGFKLYTDRLRTPGDGVMIFQGMQDHTADSIKSLDGFHRAWCEEAQSLSAFSIGLLRPTIRWEDKGRGLRSQMWFSWNPRRKSDPVDAMLRGPVPPSDSLIVRANWKDNPWFPSVLAEERLDCLRADPDGYAHIWEGDYATAVSGAYFARQITEARREGRIGRVPRDPLLEVRAYWDIGGTGARADATAIWLVQSVGKELRWLDHYEASGQPLEAHVNWLRARPYPVRTCILPHDGVQHDRVYAVSYEGALRAAGFEVLSVANQGRGAAMQRVEALRRLFPACWFNEATTGDGLAALGWYHAKKNEAGHDMGPEHDWSSHSADAAGLVAVHQAQAGSSPRRFPKFEAFKVI